MRFTVLWTPSAERDLATLWEDAADRNAITFASHTIDTLLRERAKTCGESRYDTVRIMFAPPLGVLFEVLEEDRTVYVLAVWSFDKGASSS